MISGGLDNLRFLTISGGLQESILTDKNLEESEAYGAGIIYYYTYSGLSDILSLSGLNTYIVMFGLPERFLCGFEVKENKITAENFVNEVDFGDYYLKFKIYDSNGKEIIHTSQSLGTGTIIEFEDEFKKHREKFRVVVKGDTTGDGKITPVDALVIIKHINNKITLETEAHIEAGRVRPESRWELTATDALAIIKHLNNKYEIKQVSSNCAVNQEL